MKLGFFVLGKKGYFTLRAVLSRCRDVDLQYVVVSRDPGMADDYFSRIIQLCSDNSIETIERASLRQRSLPIVDLCFAIGWRWMIHNVKNVVVLHDSPLPRYRGFSPIVNMLINGEKEFGVTALKASENYDAGPVLLQKKVSVDYPIKYEDALNKLLPLFESIVIELIRIGKTFDELEAKSQNEKDATFSIWRDRLDYRINWNWDAEKIQRFVDAVGPPFEGAQTLVDGVLYCISKVSLASDVYIENRESAIGKVIFMENKRPVVVCREGLLKIEEMHTIDNDFNRSAELPRFRSRFT